MSAVVATTVGVMPTNHSAAFWLVSCPDTTATLVPVLPATMLELAGYHRCANGTADVPKPRVSPVRICTACRATCGITTWTPGLRFRCTLLSPVIDLIGDGALNLPSLATAA